MRQAQELSGGLFGLARSLTMHAKAITGVGVELQLRRPLQQSQAREEIGAFFGGDGIALALDAFIDLAQH